MYVYHYLYVSLNSLISLSSLISKAISEKHEYYGNLSHPGDLTFNRHTLFSILCQNSFPDTLCQNAM